MMSAPIARQESPPRGGVGCLFGLVLVREGDVERLGEALAEVVARRSLDGLAVGHQRLDGRRRIRAGELVVFGLLAAQHRDRQHVLVDALVLPEAGPNLPPTRPRRSRGRCVALLPHELLRPEERLRLRGLPPHDRTPLIEPHRQIAVAAGPLGHEGRDDRFARGTNGQSLLEFLVAALGHPRDLGIEPFDDVLLPLEVALGDEHREVDVVDAGLLEPAVQRVLNGLPEGVAARFRDDEPAHRGVVREVRLLDDLGVPLPGLVRFRLGDSEFLTLVAHCVDMQAARA